MKQMVIRFKEENLTCWNCGDECENAVIIEWKRDYHKEIICDACLGQMVRNEKDFKILAEISLT